MDERGAGRMEEDVSGVATHDSPASEASVGDLVSRASEQLTTLVRDEMRLAQVEMAQEGRRSGIGLGLFGGAGAVAWFGIGSLVTAAILGLSLVVAPWFAAVIVGVVLLLTASALAMVGRREVSRATPVLPQESMQSVRRDVEAVKEGIHHDRS
jgi:membrane protein